MIVFGKNGQTSILRTFAPIDTKLENICLVDRADTAKRFVRIRTHNAARHMCAISDRSSCRKTKENRYFTSSALWEEKQYSILNDQSADTPYRIAEGSYLLLPKCVLACVRMREIRARTHCTPMSFSKAETADMDNPKAPLTGICEAIKPHILISTHKKQCDMGKGFHIGRRD